MNEEFRQYLHAGKKNLIIIYTLFLSGVIAPLLTFIGAILAYVNKDIADKTLSSHYVFLLRTFCITFFGMILSIFTTVIFIGSIVYYVVYIWFISRIIFGFKYLIDGKEHPNPLTFWIR